MAPFDPNAIFDVLLRRDVDFVLIGGLAGLAHDAGWPTYDADILIATHADNLARVLAALTDLHAEYDTPHRPPIRPDLARIRASTGPQLFRTRHGRLDVLKEAGGETYETLMVDALAVQQQDRAVRYASLEALLRMKRAAGRPKDVAGIAAIEKALGRRER